MLAHAGVGSRGIGAAVVTGAAHIKLFSFVSLDSPNVEPESPLEHRAWKRQAVHAGRRVRPAGSLIVWEGLGAHEMGLQVTGKGTLGKGRKKGTRINYVGFQF